MKRKTYKRLMIFLCIMLSVGIGLVIFGLAGMVVELYTIVEDLQPTKEPKVKPIPPVEEKPDYNYLKEREKFMKLHEIINAIPALNKLGSSNMKMTEAYKLQKLLAALQLEIDFYNSATRSYT